MAGLTRDGFTIQTLQEAKAEYEERVRAEFEGSVTDPDGAWAKVIGILAKVKADLWELAHDVYSAMYPSTAEGVSLQSAVELNAMRPLAALPTTGWVRLDGTNGSPVDAARTVRNPTTSDLYDTKAAATISAGAALRADAKIAVKNNGAYTIRIDGKDYSFTAGGGDTTQTVANGLRDEINRTPTDLPVSGVDQSTRKFTLNASAGNVTAEFPAGLGMLVFGSTGNDGTYTVVSTAWSGTQTVIEVSEEIPSTAANGNVRKGLTAKTSADDSAIAAATCQIIVSFPTSARDADDYDLVVVLQAMPVAGDMVFGTVGSGAEVTAQDDGPKVVAAGLAFDVVTGQAGWSGAVAAIEFDVGRNDETDVELRLRRDSSLRLGGKGPVESIRAHLLQDVESVDAVVVFHNPTDITDAAGRPPHTVEAVVEGGIREDVAKVLWESTAGGIGTFGNTSVVHTDTQGYPQVVQFSRPTSISMDVDVDVQEEYGEEGLPDDAAALIAARVATDGEALGIDKNVIAQRFFASVFAAVEGVQKLATLVRKTTDPSFAVTLATGGTNTVRVAGDQTASFPVGSRFAWRANSAATNDGIWTVLSRTFSGGNTDIVTVEDFTGSSATGTLYPGQDVVAISGSQRGRFATARVYVVVPA